MGASPLICAGAVPRPVGKDNNTLGRICQQVFFATLKGRWRSAYKGKDFRRLSRWKKSEYCDFEDFGLLEEKRQRINQDLMKKRQSIKQVCKNAVIPTIYESTTRCEKEKIEGKRMYPKVSGFQILLELSRSKDCGVSVAINVAKGSASWFRPCLQA